MAAIIDQLFLQGVKHFCISPGSRNAPLSLAASQYPHTVHFDERSLSFYALGLAKGSKSPVAMITTSGSAVANLFPAIMEGFHSEIPLIFLTADRPHELRGTGANQTTDQVKLFAGHVVFQADLTSHLSEKAARSFAAEAVFQAINLKGPVHLNIPFNEPLYAEKTPLPGQKVEFPVAKISATPQKVPYSKGLILLGEMEDPKAPLKLAKRLKWPVFADLLSNARKTPTEEQIPFHSSIEKFPNPEFILHFGKQFISKKVLERFKNIPRMHVSSSLKLQDPERDLKMRVLSDLETFCDTFEGKRDPDWLKKFQNLAALKTSPFFENLPKNRPIFFGNSLVIRGADQFFFPEPCPPIFGNRGVSGIDGNIATIAGLSEAFPEGIVGVIGDQTALHDLNSFALLKERNMLLIISNNYGGRIFEHLPAKHTPHLKKLFVHEHSFNFEGVAQMFDLPYVRREALFDLPKKGIVEVLTNSHLSLTDAIPAYS